MLLLGLEVRHAENEQGACPHAAFYRTIEGFEISQSGFER